MQLHSDFNQRVVIYVKVDHIDAGLMGDRFIR